MRKKLTAIPQNLRAPLIVVCLSLTSCAWGFGSRRPDGVKIYSVQPNDSYCVPQAAWCQGRAGLVRKQDKEVKPFSEAKGWFAVSPADMQKLVSACPQP